MKKFIIGIIGIIIVAFIIFYAFKSPEKILAPSENTDISQIQTTQNPINPTDSSSGTLQSSSTPMSAIENVVTYSENGFTPKDITVKVGETVKFINKSGQAMWVGSDEHPTHMQYSGTILKEHCPDTAGISFDQCKKGDEYSFTFKKAGKWNYHNHSKANITGVVIVQ
ncbi:MAG TPA: hypothetical protein VJJ28_02155 [Candidatus Paceibacterota bacterium]